MAGSTSSTKKPRPKAVTPPVSEALAGFGGADPFASSDPFGSGKTSTAGGNDPFGSFADFGSGVSDYDHRNKISLASYASKTVISFKSGGFGKWRLTEYLCEQSLYCVPDSSRCYQAI